MSETSRLRWQCRRGMRELDELLLGFLENQYPDASDKEKRAFQEVLALSDPELNSYLLQRHSPTSGSIAHVIQSILSPPAT